MSAFICPVCKKQLGVFGNAYKCENGHSYDIAKQGYVNLLMSQQSAVKRHGDDKAMIRARGNFLSKGYYQPLLDMIGALLPEYDGSVSLLDAGCGEGWYMVNIKEIIESTGAYAETVGVDISKDAVAAAARRDHNSEFAVASVFDIPVQDDRFDIVLNIFSPEADEEFRRVLKYGGVLVKAWPLEKHLMGLKEAVYELPRENEVVEKQPAGFEKIASTDLKYSMNIEKEDIADLFMMTPYYYKTGAADQQKLLQLEELFTDIQFRVEIYRKI